MDLTPYVESLRADLDAAAAAGTEQTRETAQVLSGALDAAVRLCLLDALSAMAAEVTAATDLAEVEVRMQGRDPQVVVRVPEAPPAAPDPPPTASEDDDDRATARVTLRLPESLKAEAEACASTEGLSVNAWMVRAVAGAARPSPWIHPSHRLGRRITGFARG